MKIDIVAVGKVKPYPHNPRIITEEAITATVHSIKRYGWRQPIVVDKDFVIVVGHTRLEAAKVLGTTQPKVSNLLNGRLQGFSMERLLRFLNALDRDVQIVVKRRGRSRKRARFTVEVT